MTQTGEHAVVIGASMAGLCAAAALADTFDRVTVLDRDRLPEQAANRKGTPQDRHIHLLLAAGARALESLFPGLLGELTASGARIVAPEQARLVFGGHRLARLRPDQAGTDAPASQAVLGASRPLLESHVRARLRARSGVEVRDGLRATDMVLSADNRRVTGLRVQARSGGGPHSGDQPEWTLPADLVVDCSGRRSPVPGWLEPHGFQPPPVERLAVDLTYATRHYRLPAGVLAGDGLVTIGPTSDSPRGGVMLSIEQDMWVATLFGLCDERPGLDPADFETFAGRLPFGDLHEAVRQGEALDAPAGFRYPANERRRYERVGELPAGLLVAGDAVCSFNPIYGQGMTIAALEAETLRAMLTEGRLPPPSRWFAAIAPVVDTAWQLAVGADLAVRCVGGKRPLRSRLQQTYLQRLQAAASQDATVADQFLRVAGHLDPPSRLLRPAILARVLGARWHRNG